MHLGQAATNNHASSVMSHTMERGEEREPFDFANVWHHLRKGDSRTAVRLFRLLERNQCTSAAHGFLNDLAERIAEAPSRMGSQVDARRFIEAGTVALNECLRNDPSSPEQYLRAALRMKTPRFGDLFRFRLVHVFLLTVVCAAAVSFIGDITAVAAIYLCVLAVILPLYMWSLYRASRGDFRAARNALLTSFTLLIVFLISMTRGEIRDFYPLPLWSIPLLLVLAATYVDKTQRANLVSPVMHRNTSSI